MHGVDSYVLPHFLVPLDLPLFQHLDIILLPQVDVVLLNDLQALQLHPIVKLKNVPLHLLKHGILFGCHLFLLSFDVFDPLEMPIFDLKVL